MNYKIDFHTAYNSFFLTSDSGSAITNGLFKSTDKVGDNRLLQAKNLLTVTTGSYGHIRGEIIILKAVTTEASFEKYDHVVEAGLDVESGLLQILECPGSGVVLQVKVNPGYYRVRVYSSNLVNVDIDEDEGDDTYKIEVWPAPDAGLKVLKRYEHSPRQSTQN